MAKTIKEMAENEYPIRYNAGYRCTYDLNADGRNGYFKGANAVLDLLKETLQTPIYCVELNKFIKELKGEEV